MKLFTVEEANALIPLVRPKLEKMKAQYAKIAALRETAKVAASEFGGGGMESGTIYVKALYEIGKITTEFYELGVQLKDYTRGLIDFPCSRNGQIVLLCWQLGEAEKIQWWHELEAGFAGRKPL